MGGKDLLNH